METKLYYSSLVSIASTWLTFLFGSWDLALIILVTVIGLDYVTGVMKAMYLNKLNSGQSAKGIIRKFGLLFAVIVANLADMLFGSPTPMFRTLAVYFYVATEVISVFDNLNSIDVIVPDFLKKLFNRVLDQSNKGEHQKS